jgi:hypothetical protein
MGRTGWAPEGACPGFPALLRRVARVPYPLAAVPPLPDAHRPGGRWSLAVPRAPEGAVGLYLGLPEELEARAAGHAPRRARTAGVVTIRPEVDGAVPPKGVGASAAASGPGGPRSRWAREPRRVLSSREARGSRLRSPKTPESGGLSSRRGLLPPPRREGAPPGPVLRAGGSGESLAFRARRGFRPFPRHRSSSVCVDVRLGWCAVRPAGRSQRFSRAPTRVPPAPKRWASRRSGGAVPGCAGSRSSSHGRRRSADTASRSPWSPRSRYPEVPVVPWPVTPRPPSAAVVRVRLGPKPAPALVPWLRSLVGGDPCWLEPKPGPRGVRRRSNRMGCHVKDRFRRTDPLGGKVYVDQLGFQGSSITHPTPHKVRCPPSQ